MSSGAIRQTFNKPFVQSSQQLKFISNTEYPIKMHLLGLLG